MKVTDGGCGVILTYSGFLSDEEYKNNLLAHFTEDTEIFGRYRYSISDFLALNDIGVTTETITLAAQYAVHAARRNPDVVVAMVADKDLYYGLSRMWASLSEDLPWEINTLRTREEAEAWVRERVKARFGIDNPSFR